MPESEHIAAQTLVIRGVEAIEATKAGLQALEKSVDGLRADTISLQNLCARIETNQISLTSKWSEQLAHNKEATQGSRDFWLKLSESKLVHAIVLAVLSFMAGTLGVRLNMDTYDETRVQVEGTYEPAP